MANLHTLSFPGAIVRRGFWLYVWEVHAPGQVLLYVGRTGDNSSPHATAPYTRMGQHLGTIKNQNALRQHLKKHRCEPIDCTKFELVCYGPLFDEVAALEDRGQRMELHLPIRNKVGALEKKLADALRLSGYAVMNSVSWKHPIDPDLWSTVRGAFAERFPKLAAIA